MAKPKALSPNPGASTTRPKYVIVGDWVIDENWFLVRHYSGTSKHTGDAHYRRIEREEIERSQGDLAAGDPPAADKILDLCGAGFVARVLFRERGPNPEYDLLALGQWAEEDTGYLRHLVHSGTAKNCSAGRPGRHLVYPQPCSENVDIELRPLDATSQTVRAVRLWHRSKSGWHIVNRVDWERPKPVGGTVVPVSLDRVPKDDSVSVVILDDLEKGMVDGEFVDGLVKRYDTAQWFVRTKKLDVPWINVLKGRLALLMIGPEVLRQISPFERWHENGRITLDAMEAIERVPGEPRNVVLLSERRELIGRFAVGNDSHIVIWGKSGIRPTAVVQLGWAAAVMAGLVLHLNTPDLQDSSYPSAQQLVDAVTAALETADREPAVTGVPDASVVVKTLAPVAARRTGDWATERDEWQRAQRDLGIVGPPDRPELQVWRASPRLRGYIALIPEKVQILDLIGSHLRAFSAGFSPRSLGVLVQADPGTGKTHLARCLAEAFDFELLECDISQMVHREEIFEFFDLIATRQASGGRRVLAFVDEINALLDGSLAYGAFLSPLESNVYARRGRLFTLEPSVWLFTGTKVEPSHPEEKVSDFLSRMTLSKRIDYASLRELYPEGRADARTGRAEIERAARLEQVYFGASMINRYFPDVTHVDRQVLALFHGKHPESAPFREVRQIASSLRDVQHGRVTMANLADREPGSDRTRNKPQLVKLVFRPDREDN